MIDKSMIYRYDDFNKKIKREETVMRKKAEDMEEIRALSALLSDENKRCVIAAAKALKFTQKGRAAKDRKQPVGRLG